MASLAFCSHMSGTGYQGIALVPKQLYNTCTMSEKITWLGGYSVPVLCRFMMLQPKEKYSGTVISLACCQG